MSRRWTPRRSTVSSTISSPTTLRESDRMRLLAVGDLHGNVGDAERAIQHAVDLGVDEIVQVGDWGFLWPGQDNVMHLHLSLKRAGVHMRFIDGNHDQHPLLRQLLPEERNVSSHLTYMHRGSTHVYGDGTAVGFLGGAPSIDRRHRIEGVSWWPEETIEQDDVDRLLSSVESLGHGISVLFPHDAPGLPDDIPAVREAA
ncbi:MAG: metallophosphoesterase, partial [Candidatus Paceibacterota bacterium]